MTDELSPAINDDEYQTNYPLDPNDMTIDGCGNAVSTTHYLQNNNKRLKLNNNYVVPTNITSTTSTNKPDLSIYPHMYCLIPRKCRNMLIFTIPSNINRPRDLLSNAISRSP